MRPIDADALLNTMCCLDGEMQCDADDCVRYKERKYIEAAPTIEAEPVRHGRWIPHAAYEEDDIAYCDYVCSECGHEITKRLLCVPPRCENCGAKMNGWLKQEDGGDAK